MLKKNLIIICFIFINKTSFVLGQSTPNLCMALTPPNVLLLDRFTKIKLKKNCTLNNFSPSTRRGSRKKIGCYYPIPSSWAQSINYPQLSDIGLILTSSKNVMCPSLTYADFETLTLKGECLIENIPWKTLQVNRVKRLLKKSQGTPKDSFPLIFPIERLEISLYHIDNFSIPLIRQRFSLKEKS